MTARGIASVANHCKSLVTLNLGQCWKVSLNKLGHNALIRVVQNTVDFIEDTLDMKKAMRKLSYSMSKG